MKKILLTMLTLSCFGVRVFGMESGEAEVIDVTPDVVVVGSEDESCSSWKKPLAWGIGFGVACACVADLVAVVGSGWLGQTLGREHGVALAQEAHENDCFARCADPAFLGNHTTSEIDSCLYGCDGIERNGTEVFHGSEFLDDEQAEGFECLFVNDFARGKVLRSCQEEGVVAIQVLALDTTKDGSCLERDDCGEDYFPDPPKGKHKNERCDNGRKCGSSWRGGPHKKCWCKCKDNCKRYKYCIVGTNACYTMYQCSKVEPVKTDIVCLRKGDISVVPPNISAPQPPLWPVERF